MKTLKIILTISLVFYVLPAFAAANGEISIAPAKQGNSSDPRTQSWFIYDLVQETSREDSVYVKNDSDENKNIKLYAVDAYTTAQGGFALRNAEDLKTSVGKWVTLEKSLITLNPGEGEEVKFTYNVPLLAEPGEYAGGIVAEDQKPIQGQGIAVVQRVGVRIYHTIPGERREKIVLLNSEMKQKGSNRWFEATVRNSGNTSVTLILKEEITDRTGRYRSSLQSKPYTILPSSSITLGTEMWQDPIWGIFTASGGIFKDSNQMLAEMPTYHFTVLSPILLFVLVILILSITTFVMLWSMRKPKKK